EQRACAARRRDRSERARDAAESDDRAGQGVRARDDQDGLRGRARRRDGHRAVEQETPAMNERTRPSGTAVLNLPILNEGTAFTEEERTALGLHGLPPPHVETLDEQVKRAYEAYQRKDDDLERHIYLRALQDTNEVLFYRLLLDHIEEMTPMVYTPVVAQA